MEINDKWSIHSEFDNRVFINPNVQNLFVIRVQGRYKISEQVELGSGFAYFNVATQEPEVNLGFNIPEYRGQQDITWKKNWSKINIVQRDSSSCNCINFAVALFLIFLIRIS